MESYLMWFLGVCFVGLVFCSIMLIRNQMIYRYRMRALEIVSNKAKDAIDSGDVDWRKLHDKYDEAGTYDSMLYALHKWKFEQFYKEFI